MAALDSFAMPRIAQDDAPPRRGEPFRPASPLRSVLSAVGDLFDRRRASARTGPGVLWLDGAAVLGADRNARRMVGRLGAAGAPAEPLIRALAAEDPARRAALARLMSDGRACRIAAPFNGRLIEARGAPRGGLVRLELCDLTERSAAERAAAAENEAFMRALDRSGAAAWRLAHDGSVRWRSRGAGEAEPPAHDAAAERIALPDGGALLLGRQPAPEGREDRFRRFAETVTETFAHLRVGLAVFDTRRRLALANPAVAEMFGVETDWLGEKPSLRQVLDRLREARRLPEQADYPAWRAALFTLFDDPERAAFEDVWELPDGRAIQVLGRPYVSGGIVFVFEDVTEAIALQRWRSTAVEVRRATLDMLGEGVAVFGADGQTRIANPALLRIWRLDECGADRPSHVAGLAEACRPLAGKDDVWERVRAAVASGSGRSVWRGRVELADGRVLSARIAPMPDGSTLAAFSDITDSERIAEALRDRAKALEAAEEMRDALVDQLSHQLRTPLNALFGFSELLQVEAHVGPLTPVQRDYVANIRAAAGALREGVENLADLARLQVETVAFSEREVALGPALRSAAGLLERRAAEHGARLVIRDAPDELTALGDPARLRQMIFNLLAAATAAAREGDVVTAGLSADADSVTIWCAGAPCAEAAEDMGFGLARRAAEQHGGAIEIDAAAPGGPRLACRLPRRARGDAA